MSRTPEGLRAIKTATQKFPDWRSGAWPDRNFMHRLKMPYDLLMNDVFTNIYDRVRLGMFFAKLKNEARRRVIDYNKLRTKTEAGLVDIFANAPSIKRAVTHESTYDPTVFLGAAVGDLKQGYEDLEPQAEWAEEVLDRIESGDANLGDHLLSPAAKLLNSNVGRSIVNGLGPAALALFSSVAVEKSLGAILGTDIPNLDQALMALSAGLVGSKLKIRDSIDPDPVHLRLAAAVAHRQGPKSVNDLASAIYQVNTTDDRNKILNDDVRLAAKDRDPRTNFLNYERSYLVAEVVRNPRLGLSLMAQYLYRDPIYNGLMERLRTHAPNLYARYRNISLQASMNQADSKIWRDGNLKDIIRALRELEIPQLVELIANTSGLDTLRQPVDSRPRTQHSQIMIERTLIHKPSHILLDAVERSKEAVPDDSLKSFLALDDSLIEGALRVIYSVPCSVMDDRFAPGGLEIRTVSHEPAEMAKEWKAAISKQAWSIYNDILVRKEAMITAGTFDTFFALLNRVWKKRNAFKAGMPMENPTIKLLEQSANASPVAMNFLYEHYENMANKRLVFTSETSAEAVKGVVDAKEEIRNSLRKRPYEENKLAKGEKEKLESLYSTICAKAKTLLTSISEADILRYASSSLTAKDTTPVLVVEQLRAIRELQVEIERRSFLDKGVISAGQKMITQYSKRFSSAFTRIPDLGYWVS